MNQKKRRVRRSTLVINEVEYWLTAPGFKKIDRGKGKPVDLYWYAADDAIEAGYPTKSAPILVDLSDPASAIAYIEQRCGELQNEMLEWLDGDRDDRSRLAPKFDGTIASLVDCFMSDEDSSYAEVEDDTAAGYDVWFKMIRSTVGKRLLARVVSKDFRRWYREWKRLASKSGHDGTRTAYGGIQGIRMLLNYGIECGIARCRTLRADMDKIRFKHSAAREQTMSYVETKAIVLEALRLGWKNFALSQALQFETLLRQKDVIGKWGKITADYVTEPGEIILREKVWRGLTMDMISLDTDLKIRTSKTGQPVIHRTSSCELVIHVLSFFTKDEWSGPVARRPDGTPFPDRQAYAKVWRRIAKTVGISSDTQNRDSRASGISEASEAGVSDDDIRQQSGHGGKQIIRVAYKRRGVEVSKRSHEARQEFRRRQNVPKAEN